MMLNSSKKNLDLKKTTTSSCASYADFLGQIQTAKTQIQTTINNKRRFVIQTTKPSIINNNRSGREVERSEQQKHR
jgi:hypothetical protein